MFVPARALAPLWGATRLANLRSMATGADAILFPGQASQHDGMRARVAESEPALLELAAEVVGDDPFERLGDGTRYVQPAIFCASVASWRRIQDRVRPVAFAGHSLGEYAALVAGGALDAGDALRLVALRGRLTQDEARERSGGMLALLGVDAETADAIAERCGVSVANDNCPGQIVLSGSPEGLRGAVEQVEAIGAKYRTLEVEGPFHSRLMAAAVEPFAAALAEVRFREPATPVYSSVTGEPFDDVPKRLAESLVAPVRWRHVLERLWATGATRFVEVAPGKVLTGLVRRTLPDADAVAVELQPLDGPRPRRRRRRPARVSA